MTVCAGKEIFLPSENAVRNMVNTAAQDILVSTGVLASGNLPQTLETLTQGLIDSVAASQESGTGLLSQVQVMDAVWNVLFPFLRSAVENPEVEIRINRVPSVTEAGEEIVCYSIKSSLTGFDDFTTQEAGEGFAVEPNTVNPFPLLGETEPEAPPEAPPPTEPPPAPVAGLPPFPQIEEPPREIFPLPEGLRFPLRPPRFDTGFPPPRTLPPLTFPPEAPDGVEEPPDGDAEIPEDEIREDEKPPTTETEETLNKILRQLEQTEEENKNRIRRIVDALQEQVGAINEIVGAQERILEDAINRFIVSQEGTTRIILETMEETLLDIGNFIGKGFDLISGVFITLEESIADDLDEAIQAKETAALQDNTQALLSIAEGVDKLEPAVNGIGTAILDSVGRILGGALERQTSLFTFVTKGLTVDKEEFKDNICEMIQFYNDIGKTCVVKKE